MFTRKLLVEQIEKDTVLPHSAVAFCPVMSLGQGGAQAVVFSCRREKTGWTKFGRKTTALWVFTVCLAVFLQ